MGPKMEPWSIPYLVFAEIQNIKYGTLQGLFDY